MKDTNQKEIKDLIKKNGFGKSCPKIDVVNVGQGTSGYQGDFTKREIDIIKSEMGDKKTLHLFSGSSKLGDERIDFGNPNATHKGDVCEFLRNYNPDEKAKVVLLDPPYAHKKSQKEYAKSENIYLSKENKQLLKDKDLFVVFDLDKPNQTTGLFDLITKKVKPEKIIMKSWNYYVPEGYHDTCRTSAGYSGGYKKTTYLMVLERNDIQKEQKEPIYETKEKFPVVIDEHRKDLKITQEKDKKRLTEGKKTLTIDKNIANPLKFLSENQNLKQYDSVIIDDPNFDIFAKTSDTTKFFRLITKNINPKEMVLKTDRFYVPPAYKLTEGKMYVSKDYQIPEFVMKVQYDQDKLEKYNKKQQKAVDSMQKKFEKESDPKEKEKIRKSMNNLINKLTN